MSWSIEVKDPDGTLVDVDEPIHSICNSPGSLVCCLEKIGHKRLHKLLSIEAIPALADLIREIDKGNDGVFTDELCHEFDMAWSQGRESRAEYEKFIPLMGSIQQDQRKKRLGFDDYLSFCGWSWRKRTRENAVRFYLYYRAGYEITYDW